MGESQENYQNNVVPIISKQVFFENVILET